MKRINQQDNERQRSANEKSDDINMSHICAKLVLFVERWRSLIAAIGFVSFVQFVVKTKKIIVVGNKQSVAFVLIALLCG